MAECPFCQIVDGARAAFVIADDEYTIAFLDGHPAAPGHTLVAPKRHREYLFQSDDPIPHEVFGWVTTIARGIERTMDPEGISLFYTSGRLVGRVSHAHVHVVPRYEDDDINVDLRRDHLDGERADALASRLRANLESNFA